MESILGDEEPQGVMGRDKVWSQVSQVTIPLSHSSAMRLGRFLNLPVLQFPYLTATLPGLP